MSDIIWPERYTPGTTDNYVSNEIIVAGLLQQCLGHSLPRWFRSLATQGGSLPFHHLRLPG